MSYEGKPLGPNALADEEEHSAFLRKCELELDACEATIPQRAFAEPIDAGIFKKMGELIGKELRALRERIDALEAQSSLKYVGTWKAGGDYKPGQVVSYEGGMWHCKALTGTRPSRCAEAWQLCVKSGRAK
jgi:hypothetical protein